MKIPLLLLMFFSLFSISLAGIAEKDAEEFDRMCIHKNNNNFCDMECRDLRRKRENDDCLGKHMEEREVVFTMLTDEYYFNEALVKEKMENPRYVKEILPEYIHWWSWRIELPLRNASHTQIQLRISPEEFVEKGIHCLQNGGDEKKRCPLDLTFTVFARTCAGCPSVDDFLSILRDPKVMDPLGILRVPESSPSSNGLSTVIVALLATVAFILFIIFGVSHNSPKKAFSTSRMKKFIHAPTWKPPKEMNSRKMSLASSIVSTTNDFEELIDGGYQQRFQNQPPPRPGSALLSIPLANPFLDEKHYKNRCIVIATPTRLHEIAALPTIRPYSAEETDRLLADKAESEWRAGGIDINHVNDNGETAFMIAVRHYRRHLAERLLNLGADGNLRTNLSALHHSVENADVKMLEMLLGKPQLVSAIVDGRPGVDALNDNCMTPLMLCATIPGIASVLMGTRLIEAGAKIDDQGEQSNIRHRGKTALHFAAEYGNSEMVKLLLETAKEMNIRIIDITDDAGNTALFYVCRYSGKKEIVELLIEEKVNQHLGEPHQLPRDVAVENGYGDIVEILDKYKESGKNSNEPNPNKYAVKRANAERNARRGSSGSSSSGSSPRSASSAAVPNGAIDSSPESAQRAFYNLDYGQYGQYHYPINPSNPTLLSI